MNSTIKILKDKRNQLIDDVLQLEFILEEKKEKLNIGNSIQEMHGSKSVNREGIYEKVKYLSNYEEKWKKSFYIEHRLIAEKYSNSNLSEKKYREAKKWHSNKPFPDLDGNDYYYENIIVFCEAIIPTSKGTILKLSDPFGSILTEPIKYLNHNTEQTLINRMLIAEIGYHSKNNKRPVKSIKTLKYNLYDSVK